VAFSNHRQRSQLQGTTELCGHFYWVLWINEIKESPLIIHKAMALPSGSSTMLSNPIGIRLVLLVLVVTPVAVLVLPFNVDCHFSD
jgi:hypothetical protein